MLWNVNLPGYGITMSLCQATCTLFCGEPQHILWCHHWQDKTDMNFVKKKKKKKKKTIEIMQGCTLKRMMLCQIKFGLLFKISNYHSCVLISRQCSKNNNR